MCEIVHIGFMLLIGIFVPIAYLLQPRDHLRAQITKESNRILLELTNKGIPSSDRRLATIERIGEGSWKGNIIAELYRVFFLPTRWRLIIRRGPLDRILVRRSLDISILSYIVVFSLYQFDVCAGKGTSLGSLFYTVGVAAVIVSCLVAFLARVCFYMAVATMRYECDRVMDDSGEERQDLGLDRAGKTSEKANALLQAGRRPSKHGLAEELAPTYHIETTYVTQNYASVQQHYPHIDYPSLVKELVKLLDAIRHEEGGKILQSTITAAQAAAECQDEPTLLRNLKIAGREALRIAENIGVPVAEELLKRVLGG